jgi:hypothetical protein
MQESMRLVIQMLEELKVQVVNDYLIRLESQRAAELERQQEQARASVAASAAPEPEPQPPSVGSMSALRSLVGEVPGGVEPGMHPPTLSTADRCTLHCSGEAGYVNRTWVGAEPVGGGCAAAPTSAYAGLGLAAGTYQDFSVLDRTLYGVHGTPHTDLLPQVLLRRVRRPFLCGSPTLLRLVFNRLRQLKLIPRSCPLRTMLCHPHTILYREYSALCSSKILQRSICSFI